MGWPVVLGRPMHAGCDDRIEQEDVQVVLPRSILPCLVLPVILPQMHAPAEMAVQVQQLEPCSGMTDEECCEQRLATTGFRASGEHLPDLTMRAVRLSCADKAKLGAASVCKGIAFSRGFPAKEVATICKAPKPRKECRDSELCSKCRTDLVKLGYQKPHWACHAVTHQRPPDSATKVVVLSADGTPSVRNSGQVIKRRRRVR